MNDETLKRADEITNAMNRLKADADSVKALITFPTLQIGLYYKHTFSADKLINTSGKLPIEFLEMLYDFYLMELDVLEQELLNL